MADETNKEALEAVEWIDGYVSRLRAEIDALRAALEDIQLTAHYAKDFQGDAYDLGARCARIEQRAKAALNTQPAPAAEWTPRDKQDVRVIDTGHSMHGKVGAIVRRNDTNTWFWIDFDPSDYDGKEVYQLRLDQIAPVDESEAQAKWTPRLGDTVRVKDDAIEMAEWRGFNGVVENRYIGRAVVCRADVELNVPIEELERAVDIWTPRLGEEVWINADSRVGTVIRINQDSDYPYGVAWDSPAQVNEWYAIEDISRHEFD